MIILDEAFCAKMKPYNTEVTLCEMDYCMAYPAGHLTHCWTCFRPVLLLNVPEGHGCG